MIVFNEGTPGSGKSYDAMLSHILPALAAGRHVYARINGLDYARIAEHLKLPPERVSELLHDVHPDQVRELPKVVVNDALVVIDEAHEFFKSGRQQLDPELEDFFAKHRHKGLDIVLMSQFYRRVHMAVRARIERKAVFSKLQAIGKPNMYVVRHYQTIEPDKYEKLDAQTKSYDPAIFPLYKTAEEQTKNLEVYTGGAVTIWRKLGRYALVMIPLGIWAIWYVVGFFSGSHEIVHAGPSAQSSGPQQKAPQATGTLSTNAKPPKYETDGMPPEVAYVFELANQARPRLAALAIVEGKPQPWGIVEFRESQQHVMERLSLGQLRGMGVEVALTSYGVRISYKKQALVVTPWPVDMPGTVSQEPQDRMLQAPTDSPRPRRPSVSEPSGVGVKPSTTSDQSPMRQSYDPAVFLPRAGK